MTIRELLGLINLPIKYYSDFDMLTKLEEETLLNSFHEDSITLISKQDKDATQKS